MLPSKLSFNISNKYTLTDENKLYLTIEGALISVKSRAVQ